MAGELALTFDDGPDPVDTRRLLALLAEHGVKGTFFVFGEKAALHPDVVREVVAAGHSVQPHCWSHAQSHHELSADGIAADFDRVLRLLDELDVPKPTLWRPPWGKLLPGVSRALAADRGLAVVGWTVTVVDWEPRPGADLYETLVGDLDPTATNVVLMHDGHVDTGQTRTDASNTLDALGLLLTGPPREYVLVKGGVEGNLCEAVEHGGTFLAWSVRSLRRRISMARSLTSQLFRLARLSASGRSIRKGTEGRRAKNIIVGRALGRAGVWRRLWK